MTPSKYLLKDMPREVLFGEAAGIEAWCRESGKAVPTLLDVGLARKQVRRNRNKRGGKR